MYKRKLHKLLAFFYIGISFLAKPIWVLFYGESTFGPSVLTYYIFVGFFVGLFTATVTILQTMKDYKSVFVGLVIGVLFKILLNSNLILAFYKMGLPPYYGVITASIIGYLVSFIYCVLVLHFQYQIKFEEIVRNFIDILCGTFFMILILMIVRFFVPIVSPQRIVNLFLVLIYGIIGMVVYFGYARMNQLTHKIFGKDIIHVIQKVLLKK